MRGKAWLIFLMILGLARALVAGLVTLNDGTSLSGELKEQDNGDVIVVTGAGEVKVAKDKIRSIIKDASVSGAAQGDFSYVNKVKARREKYGNEDGLPRTQMINQTQVSFSLGYLSNFGDALGTDASNFNGPYFGLSIANSFNDLVGWELWGGYGFGQHDYGAGNVFAGRWDVAFEPRLQKAISLGAVEQQIMFIPHFGVGPVLSGVLVSVPGDTEGAIAVGGVFSLGVDFQFGPALVGIQYRYLLSYLTSDSNNFFASRNASAGLAQVNVGWAF